MGLLDGVKSFGSSILNKAKEVENEVEQKVSETEKAVVQKAEDAFDTVKQAPVALANAVGSAESAVASEVHEVAHSWKSTLTDAAKTFGSDLQAAGGAIEKGSKALAPFVPFAAEGVAVGAATKALGGAVKGFPSEAASLVKGAEDLVHKGEDFVHKAEDATVSAAKSALSTVEAGVEAAKNGVEHFVSEVASAVDYGHNIDELGEGDTYTLGVGGDVSVEGAKVYGKGEIEVEKNEEGKYVVSVDGELGGGVYGEVGGKIGAKLDAEAEATLGVGGKMEMTFDNAEDAKRATGILLKQAAAMEAGTAIPGAGIIASAALAPSADDYKFLGEHTSAIELSGNVAGEVSAGLGLKGIAGLDGSAELKDEVSMRIELKDEKGEPKNPPELVVKNTLSGEAELSAGIAAGGEGEKASGGSAPFVGGKGEAEISVEQRFKLPTGITTEDLMKDPKGTLTKAAGQMQKSEQDKITLGLDVSGSALGNGGGVNIEASYQGNFQDLANGAIPKLLHGDVSGALKTLDKPDSLELKWEPYTTLGVSCSPSISIMGFGVGMDFQATRKDVADPPTSAKFSGSPSEAIDELNKRLAPYQKYFQAAAA